MAARSGSSKHPRLAATPASAQPGGGVVTDAGVDEGEEQRDWAQLMSDAVRTVADVLLGVDVAEYIRFRASCKPWRRATADPSLLQPRFFPRNWLVLDHEVQERDGEVMVRRNRCVNVLTGAAIKVRLPAATTAEQYGVIVTPAAEGLLLLHCRRTDTVRLFNPLTRATPAVLPGFAQQAPIRERDLHFMAAGVVVDAEAPDRPTVVVVVVAGSGARRRSVILCAKHGDDHWGTVDAGVVEVQEWDSLPPFQGGLSVKGRFYVPTTYGDVLTVELRPQPHLVYVARRDGPRCLDAWACYLMPSLDAGDDNDGMLMVRVYDIGVFHVFGVHLGQGRFTMLSDIGNRTIFLPALTLRSDKFPSLTEGPGWVHNNDNVEEYIV